MKKIILILIILALAGWGAKFVYEYTVGHTAVAKPEGIDQIQGVKSSKLPILRFALVADSENENGLLAKALDQAKGAGINFVIGLGDWSAVGTKQELQKAKKIFDDSKLVYYLVAGDHDLWDSRNQNEDALTNYRSVFGSENQEFTKENVEFVLLDNSDIYKGISQDGWDQLDKALKKDSRLKFVFSHKTPFHPTSSHVMGEGSADVANQAQKFMNLMEQNKVDGFFAGDMHFFAEFSSYASNGGFGRSASGGKSTDGVRITTVGAVDSERNFQGPRYSIVTVYDDYSWKVDDAEIR